MSTITSVNTIVVTVEDVVEDVAVTKAEGRGTRVEVKPVVVGVGDGYGSVLSTVAIRVANKRSFPVGIKFAVGNGDTSAPVGNIKETIIAKGFQLSVTNASKAHAKLTSPCRGPCR